MSYPLHRGTMKGVKRTHTQTHKHTHTHTHTHRHTHTHKHTKWNQEMKLQSLKRRIKERKIILHQLPYYQTYQKFSRDLDTTTFFNNLSVTRAFRWKTNYLRRSLRILGTRIWFNNKKPSQNVKNLATFYTCFHKGNFL